MEKRNKPIENAAIKRWLLSNYIKREKAQTTLLGDDLYSRQPICELAIKQGYNFIFVAKPSSHKTLYEWLEFLDKNREVVRGEQKKYEKGKSRIYRYKYLNNVPLRESEPSLMVNWYEVEIFDPAKNKTGKEKRFQKHINHEISRQLVNNAVSSKRSIALEDLTGIRESTNKQPRNKQERRKSNNWAFYMLRQFLTCKCILDGVPLLLVNPAYTSKSCYKCGHIGNRNGKRFSCVNPDCRNKCDPDYQGAKNISALGRSIVRFVSPKPI